MMKIKTFKCENFTDENLQNIENTINSFIATHDVSDIKVTSCCNSFGWLMMYVIVYNE